MKKTYIIAEAGVNHNGSLSTAKAMVDAAAEAGVDAIKFQMFKADQLVTVEAPLADYQKEVLQSAASSQCEMLKQLELTESELMELKEYCQEQNLNFLVTPFDELSLEFLVDQCKVKKIKVSSGDLTDTPFLWKIAKTGLPIILSTGMAMIGEIEKALVVISYGYVETDKKHADFSWEEAHNIFFSDKGQRVLRQNVILLHCTTEYPAPFNEVNLLAISTLAKIFQLPVGYSDHTEGSAASLGAVALGACVVEKHFTLDKTMAGPDHKASLEPSELKNLVLMIRQIEQTLGSGLKYPGESERKNRTVSRKSLVASKHIEKGDVFTGDNITIKRPGSGTDPSRYWDLLGKNAQKSYLKDEMI